MTPQQQKDRAHNDLMLQAERDKLQIQLADDYRSLQALCDESRQEIARYERLICDHMSAVKEKSKKMTALNNEHRKRFGYSIFHAKR